MSKLVYELEKILKTKPKIKVEIPKEVKKDETLKGKKDSKPVIPITPASEDDPGLLEAKSKLKIKPEDLPENLRIVYNTTVEKYKVQRALHEKMKLPELTDDQRAEVRAEIVKLDDDIADGWAQIDSYKPGEVKPEVKADPLLISKEINAARKYISVNIPKLSTLKGGARDAVVTKIKERYNMLVSLKSEFDPETIEELKKSGIIQ